MKATLRTDLQIELLNSTADIAELAKLAAKFGAHFTLTPPSGEQDGGYTARIARADPTWLSKDLALLVLASAMASGRSVDTVIEQLRAYLARMHAVTDKPLSDVAGIGDAPDGSD